MRKIAIVGPSGAGKTTLAIELERICGINVYHLDRIFWSREWKGKPEEVRKDTLLRIVKEKEWIVEGSYFTLMEPRFDEADTIIFLDMNPLLCLFRLWKRHRTPSVFPRRDIPIDSTDKFDVRLVQRVVAFWLRGRRVLNDQLEKYEKTKTVKRLHSPREVETYLATLVQSSREQEEHPTISHPPVSVLEKMQLASLPS